MSAAPAAGARPPPAGEPAPGSAAATPAAKQGWRPVVTAFVRRSDGRVLVVKRSDKVIGRYCQATRRPDDWQMQSSKGLGRRRPQSEAAGRAACSARQHRVRRA